MKVWPLTVLVIAGLVLAGCGPRTAVVPGGTVTTSKDGTETVYQDREGNKVETKAEDDGSFEHTYTDKDGNTTTIKGDTKGSFADTGFKPYPNTFEVKGETLVNTMEADGQKMVTGVAYTRDSVDQVLAHFKSQIEDVVSETKSGDTGMIIGRSKDGSKEYSVLVTKTDDGTRIQVSSVTGAKRQ